MNVIYALRVLSRECRRGGHGVAAMSSNDLLIGLETAMLTVSIYEKTTIVATNGRISRKAIEETRGEGGGGGSWCLDMGRISRRYVHVCMWAELGLTGHH